MRSSVSALLNLSRLLFPVASWTFLPSSTAKYLMLVIFSGSPESSHSSPTTSNLAPSSSFARARFRYPEASVEPAGAVVYQHAAAGVRPRRVWGTLRGVDERRWSGLNRLSGNEQVDGAGQEVEYLRTREMHVVASLNPGFMFSCIKDSAPPVSGVDNLTYTRSFPQS